MYLDFCKTSTRRLVISCIDNSKYFSASLRLKYVKCTQTYLVSDSFYANQVDPLSMLELVPTSDFSFVFFLVRGKLHGVSEILVGCTTVVQFMSVS